VVVADEEEHMRTVGELADLAGVTVPTLHHYDEIGLLSPSARSPAGYRLYDQADLLRLRRILFYRELAFPLDDIAAIVADKDVDAGAHLRRQHRLLRERIERMCSLVDAIEHEMEAQKLGISLTPEEQFEVFGPDYRGEEWAAESEHRWGDTDAWSQSNRRTSAYPKEDWLRIKAEADGIEQRFAELLRSGAPADGAAAIEIAREHRQHIARWFYDCPPAMHRGLGDMYVTDARFTAHYDAIAPGLARFVRDAFAAEADSAGAKSPTGP